MNTSPMPFGFRRFSPPGPPSESADSPSRVTNAFRLPPLFSHAAHGSIVYEETCRHQCLSASAAFLPWRAHSGYRSARLAVTNAFRLPPLFSPDVHRRHCGGTVMVTNAFRLPPLFSHALGRPATLIGDESHQCLSASAAFLPRCQSRSIRQG